MSFRIASTLFLLVVFLSLASRAQQPVVVPSPGAPSPNSSTPVTNVPLSSQHLSKQTRMELMRLMNAEFATTKKLLPMGEKGLTIRANGPISPNENELRQIAANLGVTSKPNQRVQITNVEIKDKTIQFEINGGPKKKSKWYQRIEVGGIGGTTPVAQNPSEHAKGSVVNLVFDKFVPEISVADLKQLLSPIFDFTFKSATEAYLDSLPPKVKEAVKNHEVLVGMNRELVVDSLGRPIKKVRERGDDGKEFEDWMYGMPPQDVKFIRFVGDEVTQVKIMPMGQEMILRTQKEVDLNAEGISKPKTDESAQSESQPAHAPTLRRPGEGPQEDTTLGSAPMPVPKQTKTNPTQPPIGPPK